MRKITLLVLFVISMITVKAQIEPFTIGNGTSGSPYEIRTPGQLENLRNFLGESGRGKYFKITGEIDLESHIATYYPTQGWNPIGGTIEGESYDQPNSFQGNLDGQNNTIKNLWINRPVESHLGIFASLAYAQVKNVNIQISVKGITGKTSVGALFGSQSFYGIPTLDDNVLHIENCTVTGGVISGEGSVGAIGGAIRNITMKKCRNEVNVNGVFEEEGTVLIGGLCGWILYSCHISDCSNAGKVFSRLGGSIGGIVGDASGEALNRYYITGCSNTGMITGGMSYVGGIVGHGSYAVITHSYNKGEIRNISKNLDLGVYTGGIAGSCDVIEDCYNAGRISGKDKTGGLAGTARRIVNSHNESAVQGNNYLGGICGVYPERKYIYEGGIPRILEADSMINCHSIIGIVYGKDYAGGLVGGQDYDDFLYGYIIDSYSKSEVRGRNYVGGICGKFLGLISNCSFSNNNIKGNNNVGGFVGSSRGEIYNSYAETGKVTGYLKVGGFVGESEGFSYILYCHSDLYVTGKDTIGGFVGHNKERGSSIYISYSLGTVEATGNKVGGFAGVNDFHISECYSNSNVKGVIDVGGIVGFIGSGDVLRSNFTGTVNGATNTGGIAGSNTGDVRDSHVKNSTITGKYNIGGLVGNNSKGTIYYDTTNNVTVTGIENIGGLVGFSDGTIYHGSAQGKIIGAYSVGGFVGFNEGTVDKGDFTGDIEMYDNYNSENAGGFVGINWGQIQNGISNANVTGETSIGGFAGLNGNVYKASITKSAACGTVEGYMYTGGFVGHNYGGKVSECFNISRTNGMYETGGFTGYNNYGVIENCYTHGRLIDPREEMWDAGGFVSTDNSDILNCYSTTEVMPTESFFGFVLWGNPWGNNLTTCFFDYESAGVSYGDENEITNRLSTHQMKYRQPFVAKGWNFTNIWENVEGCKSPYLQWQKNIERGENRPRWMSVMLTPGSAGAAMGLENNLNSWYNAVFNGNCDNVAGYPAPPAPKSTDGGDLLGIDEVKEQTLSISPNPTTGIVNIKGNNLDVKVYDMQGRQIIHTKDKTVDISTYPSGVYIFNINGKIEKIIKQ